MTQMLREGYRLAAQTIGFAVLSGDGILARFITFLQAACGRSDRGLRDSVASLITDALLAPRLRNQIAQRYLHLGSGRLRHYAGGIYYAGSVRLLIAHPLN